MSLIFSPFVGFAIHGKVATTGLVIGLLFAIIPLSGLVVMVILRWYAWRQLPQNIAEEWTSGKIVPAEGAPAVSPPVRFSNKEYWIEMLAGGLVFSRSSLLSMQGVPQVSEKLWAANNTGQIFIPWPDVLEWCVDIDSDGPDYYLLKLRPGGQTRVRRFSPDRSSECDLFDAVRSVGKIPVRLRCDVDCK